ncbi:MAG: LapA family protein [Gammaproteobacteria bacterium]|nr:LapA family protein [Gammaproteobacteria bacterium]
MVRNFIFFAVLLIGLLVATAFAALNPGSVRLDLAFFETDVQKSLALTVAFGLGWVFGLLCAGVVLLRSANEQRKLRKSLGRAEAEVDTLRNMPIQDAD